MKIYKSSDLTHKRAEVLRAAEDEGVLIQVLRTNGEVINEIVMISKAKLDEMECDYNIDRFVGLSDLINTP